MTQAKILLTGATGTVGKALAEKLSAMNVPFKALVRNGANADFLKSLPQAEIVPGDLADKNSLATALQGIDKAFLLTNSSEDAEQLQLNFAHAAKKAGLQHIVKLSQLAADVHSPVRFLRYHAKIENTVKELGIPYTFLRPNLYMQGLLAFKEYIKNDGRFYASIGDAKISAVDVKDIASVAAVSLTGSGHENKTYNITGPSAISHFQMADMLARVLNKKIEFVDIDPEQMAETLRSAAFPTWQIGGLIEDYAHYARGEAAAVYNDVRQLTGNDATSFEEFVINHQSLFL